MKTNDLKKGSIVMLSNGWKAMIEDNMRGDIRMATVYGDFTEMGSVYSHDISKVLVAGEWHSVEHTPAQLKLRQRVAAMGF
jgi:hypothetical protein